MAVHTMGFDGSGDHVPALLALKSRALSLPWRKLFDSDRLTWSALLKQGSTAKWLIEGLGFEE